MDLIFMVIYSSVKYEIKVSVPFKCLLLKAK